MFSLLNISITIMNSIFFILKNYRLSNIIFELKNTCIKKKNEEKYKI